MKASRVSLAAGVAALAVALLPPLHGWSERYFSAHMIQHTILMTIAAPLLVLGRPVLTFLWVLPVTARRRLTQHGAIRSLRRVAEMPVLAAFAVHSLAIWAWHVPVLFDLAVHHEAVHALQHASFLLSALLFWQAVLAPRTRAVALGKGVLLVFAVAAHTAVLGAMIALSRSVLYETHAHAGHTGLTPLQDQQLAGFIMWVPCGLLYTLIGVALLAGWFRQMEIRNATRSLAAGSAALILCCAWLAGCGGFEREQALDERAAAVLTGGNPRTGRDIIEQVGCGGCHTIAGVRDARGEVGPPLNGIVRRTYVAGVITNTPVNLTRWIEDPKAVDTLTAMPNLGLTIQQARDVAAYLYTLK